VLDSEDFPSLPLGGCGRGLVEGSSAPAPFFLVGEVPILVAATGAPPPPGVGVWPLLGFPVSPAGATLGLVQLGRLAADGPQGLGPSGVLAGERLDPCQVSQGQKGTAQIAARGVGHPLSAFTPTPPVQKWLWLRAGTKAGNRVGFDRVDLS
jgi:hypothetical protein